MGLVKILTDSTADLPAPLVSQYGIEVIPLKVIFEDKIYRDTIDITNKEFYEKLAAARVLPRTSQPSPGEFQELYEELTADGSTVISIHISAKMSGTIQSAVLAKNRLPDRDIRVIDSRQVSMALGLVVLAAAKAARQGKSPDEIELAAIEVANKVRTYFVVDSLENLEKGGRIGKASAFLGNMLNIKPVLTIEDGVVSAFEKIRGKSRAMDRIVEVVKDYEKDRGISYCTLLHANAVDDAVELHKKLISRLDSLEHIIGEIGAVVGTHAGAGTIGIIFY